MGEAKRRKKLDPNYGKSPIMGWRTESAWKRILRIPEKDWARAKSDLRVINSINDIDESINAIWIYKDDKGDEIIKPTGIFASDISYKKLELIEKLNSVPFGEHVYEDDKGEITVTKSRDEDLTLPTINTRFRIDYEAKVTITDDKIYEDECYLETTLDLGIKEEEDWFNVDEGIIYGEAFKEAMSAFYDSYIYKETYEMFKEATITIKKVELKPREQTIEEEYEEE